VGGICCCSNCSIENTTQTGRGDYLYLRVYSYVILPLKKDLEHIARHIVGDLAVVGVLAAILFVGLYFNIPSKFGLNSYNGLSPSQIRKVYAEFQRRYPPLSKVGGMGLGGYFERGVAGSQGGVLYYFHYTDDGRGGVSFSLYPEIYEVWTTDPGVFNVGRYFTGEMK